MLQGSPGQVGPLAPSHPALTASDFKEKWSVGLHQAPCRPLHAPEAPPLPPGLQPFLFPSLPSLPPLSVSLSFLSSSLTLSLTSNASSCAAQHGPTFLLSQKSGHRTGAQGHRPPRRPHFKASGKSISLSTDMSADVSPGSASA